MGMINGNAKTRCEESMSAGETGKKAGLSAVIANAASAG
jgi:hypothetical protein